MVIVQDSFSIERGMGERNGASHRILGRRIIPAASTLPITSKRPVTSEPMLSGFPLSESCAEVQDRQDRQRKRSPAFPSNPSSDERANRFRHLTYESTMNLEPYTTDDDSIFIAPNATVLGSVRLQAQASIWFGAVVRGDVEHIHIGNQTNIQDLCVIHADPGFPCEIGDRVTVGTLCNRPRGEDR